MEDARDAQLRREVEAGERAKRLMAELEESFTQIEQAIMKAWRDAPTRDVDGQQLLKLRMQALDEVKKYIEGTIKMAQFAENELAAERTRREKESKSAVRLFRR